MLRRREAVAASVLALMAIGACSSNNATEGVPDPIWAGPPIAARSAETGDMELVVVAPTANYDLTLKGVEIDGETAEVTVDFITPGDAITAQIMTQVREVVPASRLGSTTRVRFWIAEVSRTDEGSAPAEPVLSLIQLR